MAFLQSDLDRINAAIASGTLEVHIGDRMVRYQSMADLLRAKSDIEAELMRNSGTPIVRQIRPVVTSGWK